MLMATATLPEEIGLSVEPVKYVKPVKRIQDGGDVQRFHRSKAYKDIMSFIMQLNRSMFPALIQGEDPIHKKTQTWDLDSGNITFSETVTNLRLLLNRLAAKIQEAPPDTGPRRFGNASFRKWYSLVETSVSELLRTYLPPKVLASDVEGVDACVELEAYLLGSFGSPQRLDYGTGHELSYVAFLACVWKVGGFETTDEGVEERGIVLGLIEPYVHRKSSCNLAQIGLICVVMFRYLQLVRQLIQTYTLEPAGSHGVWGLDDHSFIPYILGSAQFGPVIASGHQPPTEGSLAGAPDPADVAKSNVVQRERKRNMYFSAVGFIYDVKKGPFWEHSPMLFDISGVQAGWAKINKVTKFPTMILSYISDHLGDMDRA